MTELSSPRGHYSHSAAGGGLLFLSGQLPNPAIGNDASFGAQVRSAIGQLFAVLRDGGSTPDDLLKINAYIVGIEHWPEFNTVYSELLGGIKPARAVIPVPALHYGWLIEVDAIAVHKA
jgi:2-iminobutanoate/2-iminopropanoate deaminase